MVEQSIKIRGAREHNLKNIDVTIPKHKLVVITGLSGSGKSSLAFDTLYAEGQRRYVESLSAYARQFLQLMEKPDVENIEGLSPAISIEQKTTSKNPRSTVGTVTEIYDYLRLLFARVGVPHCPECGRKIESQTVQAMVDSILAWPEGTKVMVLSPVVRDRKGEYKKLFQDAVRGGFVRGRVDGDLVDLSDPPELDKKRKHSIDIVVDRLVIKAGIKNRLTESVELALEHAHGLALIHRMDKKKDVLLSERLNCMHCDRSLPDMEPRLFSFNSPHGACPRCDGLGQTLAMDIDKVITDPTKPTARGALEPWKKEHGNWFKGMVETVLKKLKVDPTTPWNKLSKKVQKIMLHGSGDQEFEFVYRKDDNKWKFTRVWEGALNNLERRFKETNSEGVRDSLAQFMSSNPCEQCKGQRLRPEALAVKVAGYNLPAMVDLPVSLAQPLFEALKLKPMEAEIARSILKEVRNRLSFLLNVGLGYLSMSRAANTLSGGESQRIRLATQVGSQLTGVLYVLDEPSIGLHQRDNRRLLNTLLSMKDLGNTVVVVEHDEETIRSADHLLDMGPGAGEHGGEVVAQGTVAKVMASKKSITAAYLRGDKEIETPQERRKPRAHLTIKGARANNLKNLDVDIPLGVLAVVCGISGSGKSTLVHQILAKGTRRSLHNSLQRPGAHDKITGLKNIDKLIEIDQSAIGRTPRSNPATYTGLFTPIREMFSGVQESKMRGYKPGRFSFNVKGGRCEACQGDGVLKIEMHFLPDVYVTCDTCNGKRYNRETLEIRFKGKSIHEVLDMTVEEAHGFFENVPAIFNKLSTLMEVGLGYIRLGQRATTLSGGEAQRVKLSRELSKRSTGKTLYILDEPTTGLHFDDVRQLVDVLRRLVEGGNTVLIIEHNLDVIKCADVLLELGPEGGDLGGYLVAQGTPEEVAGTKDSPTGFFLKKMVTARKPGKLASKPKKKAVKKRARV